MDSICPICGQNKAENTSHVKIEEFYVRKEYLQCKTQGESKANIYPQSAATVKNIVNKSEVQCPNLKLIFLYFLCFLHFFLFFLHICEILNFFDVISLLGN